MGKIELSLAQIGKFSIKSGSDPRIYRLDSYWPLVLSVDCLLDYDETDLYLLMLSKGLRPNNNVFIKLGFLEWNIE